MPQEEHEKEGILRENAIFRELLNVKREWPKFLRAETTLGELLGFAATIPNTGKDTAVNNLDPVYKSAAVPSFSEATKELFKTHVMTGAKIGSATFFGKKIVSAARNALMEQKGGKRWATIIDSRLGSQLAIVLIPGAAYLAAKMFPSQVPESQKVASVAGFAVTGGMAELSQVFLEKATPFFSRVAKLADELPDDVKPNGHSKKSEQRA